MSSDHGTAPDLITARGMKGVSLRQIADSTKIGVRYLEAIESGEFTRLPGGIYAVNYIRQYARAIGYSESALLERYYTCLRTNPKPTAAAPDPTEESPFTRMMRLADRVAG